MKNDPKLWVRLGEFGKNCCFLPFFADLLMQSTNARHSCHQQLRLCVVHWNPTPWVLRSNRYDLRYTIIIRDYALSGSRATHSFFSLDGEYPNFLGCRGSLWSTEDESLPDCGSLWGQEYVTSHQYYHAIGHGGKRKIEKWIRTWCIASRDQEFNPACVVGILQVFWWWNHVNYCPPG